MTTTRKLVELFRAIAAEDLTSAAEIATQLSTLEEKKGHRAVARQLRGALNGHWKSIHQDGNGSSQSPPGPSVISTALVRLKETKTFHDVVLASHVRTELEGIIMEWKHSGRLRDFGISPRSKLLLHGPPGCGKSLTAQALGNELGIPVYMVRFDAVIGAFLGQTAINLRQLFHFAETTPCVLLLDELDALGKKRGNPLDVGELDRIVISLMQELEHTKPMGVIVGTTNLPKHLDDALWRRFDLDLQLKAPTQAVLKAYAKKMAALNETAISMKALNHASQSSSFAAAEKIVIAEIRRKVLENVREK